MKKYIFISALLLIVLILSIPHQNMLHDRFVCTGAILDQFSTDKSTQAPNILNHNAKLYMVYKPWSYLDNLLNMSIDDGVIFIHEKSVKLKSYRTYTYSHLKYYLQRRNEQGVYTNRGQFDFLLHTLYVALPVTKSQLHAFSGTCQRSS